jgi:Ca-activated chloride channel homolog
VPIRLDETAGLFDERPGDITPVAPVEQLLRLEVTAWVPPDEPDWRYFTLRILRAGSDVLPVLPKDVLFVMDCSQSMTSPRVRAGREGIRNAVARLNPGDRFEVMSFQERALRCFNEWTPFDPIQTGRANFFIERMESAGQTDLFRSLEEIARMPTDPDRPAIAILVSDGRPTVGLMDYFEIIERFSSGQAGRWSMFSFGSGTRVNRFLLDFLSYANRGDSLIVRDTASMPGGIDRFAAEVSRPVLMDLGHRFSGVDDREIYPGRLTHLYLDRALVLYGRAPAAASAAGVRITGRSGASLHDMVFRLDWNRARAGDADLRTDWRWQKLNALVAEHIRTRDPAVRDAAVEIARKLGRDMPYAADLGIIDAPVRTN